MFRLVIVVNRDHLVEAFEDKPRSPIASSDTIGVSSSISGTKSGSISTSAYVHSFLQPVTPLANFFSGNN